MPNWCNNSVTITHEDPAKIEALSQAMQEGRFLNFVIPVPAALLNTTSPNRDESSAEELKAKYGATDWYDFCVNRWGTKWDVDCDGTISLDNDGRTVQASFDSAWSPPCGVYEELVEQGYDVVAFYYESGMGYVGKWDNGCDDCHELGGLDSKTVRDAIGEELDDFWCISESMAEWEEENREDDELTEWYEEGVEKKGLEPHK